MNKNILLNRSLKFQFVISRKKRFIVPNIIEKHTFSFILIYVLILFSIFLTWNYFNVSATSDESDALNQAPVGLPIAKYFTIHSPMPPQIDSISHYPFLKNSAYIDSNNPNILVLAHGNEPQGSSLNKGVSGAAWSDIDQNNYIDITKKQTVSVWLYFGSGNGDDKTKNGEGIALVLQNDNNNKSESSHQSYALGAGYQSMGTLGYDLTTFKKGSYLGFPTYNVTYPTSDYVAKTAIQNSISLDFDTDRNDTNTTSNSNPYNSFGPIKMYNINSLLGYTNEYTMGGFDTTDTFDTDGAHISHDFPAYDDIHAMYTGNSYPLRQGNSGSQYGVISLTYPGNPLTYQLGKLINRSGDYAKFLNHNYNNAMSTVQVFGKDATLIDGQDNNDNPLYWHHLTYTWNPAKDSSGKPTTDGMPVKDGTPATVSYNFNDIMPDGSNNINNNYYQPINDTIPVDPSQFHLSDGNTKVFWGLTGANSFNPDVYSKLAIFESIPALATATLSTKITDFDKVDENGNKEIISDDDKINTLPNRTVYDGDNLIFNYHLQFDSDSSHQNWNQIAADIKLPTKDINFTDGSITYHNDAGQSKTVPIPLNWDTTDPSQIKYQLAYSLGNLADSTSVNDGTQYTSADINFDGKANNATNDVITITGKTAIFKGTNAVETGSSPLFKITNQYGDKKQLKLTVSKNLVFDDINYVTNKTIIHRKNPFTLNVTSLQSPWVLQVSTDGLFYNGDQQRFNGNLIYKNNDDANPIVLSTTLKQIAENETPSDELTTEYLAKNWNNNDGILLQPTKPNNEAGKYTGQLTWNLVDSMANIEKNPK